MNMIELTEREKDVRKLANKVLNTGPTFFDNPNGGYENRCPFCYNMAFSDENGCEIKDIKHSTDCAWLIAKDLMTGI